MSASVKMAPYKWTRDRPTLRATAAAGDLSVRAQKILDGAFGSNKPLDLRRHIGPLSAHVGDAERGLDMSVRN